MKRKRVLAATVFAVAALFAGPGQAAEMNYVFGDFISGEDGKSFPQSPQFAKLNVKTDAASDSWTFRLYDVDLDIFGESAFFGSLAVDGIIGSEGVDVTSTESSFGLNSVGVDAGSGPGGVFDFRFDLDEGQTRLTTGNYVKWTATGISSVSSYAGHIQGIGDNGEFSAWYGADPSPIPLPATVWLLGSALLGFSGFKKFIRARKGGLTPA
ncbi:MAG: hypothetical protein KGY54_12210 [Oleiphilaceae bacterium]|nr:hypothetical protein [Oleiphilaceae bacterium]